MYKFKVSHCVYKTIKEIVDENNGKESTFIFPYYKFYKWKK